MKNQIQLETWGDLKWCLTLYLRYYLQSLENKFERARAEFFLCSHSTKEEFIVYITQTVDSVDEFLFDFYKSNGTHIYSKKFTIEGIDFANGYTDLQISPNGKFLLFKIKSSKLTIIEYFTNDIMTYTL